MRGPPPGVVAEFDASGEREAVSDGAQLLVRALLFRLLADPDPAAHASVFGPAGT